MTDLNGSLPVPSDDVLVTELPDGESVLLDLKTEAYFGLNELGTAVWAVLAGDALLDDLVAATAQESGVAERQIRADIAALLAELVERGLAIEP